MTTFGKMEPMQTWRDVTPHTARAYLIRTRCTVTQGVAYVEFNITLFGDSQRFSEKVGEKQNPDTFLGNNPLLSLEH